MIWTTDKYINLFTDFGFKKLFGEEPNKELLIAFLNDLLVGSENIIDLTYLNNEKLGRNQQERKAIYDLYCTNQDGEKFIVEIQRVKQEFFKERTIFYSTFAIQEQAERGKDWLYELKSVYTIAIMDFVFDSSDKDKIQHRVKLLDVDTHKVFYDKLTFIYLEVPKFDKSLEELTSNYERWLYAFRNLHRLREKPKELQAGVFKKLFELAEIASMGESDRNVYEESLKDYRDLKSSLLTAHKEGVDEGIEIGKEEGKLEGKLEANRAIAIKAFKQGLSVDVIATLTELTPEQVTQLLNKHGLS